MRPDAPPFIPHGTSNSTAAAASSTSHQGNPGEANYLLSATAMPHWGASFAGTSIYGQPRTVYYTGPCAPVCIYPPSIPQSLPDEPHANLYYAQTGFTLQQPDNSTTASAAGPDRGRRKPSIAPKKTALRQPAALSLIHI